MKKYDFPKMFGASYSYLRMYDFIFDAVFDRRMSDCYKDIIERSEDYIEIFSYMGYDLEINPDLGYVHILCYMNRSQNLCRAMKVCAIADWLSKAASENTLLVNGEIVPGNRFSEEELLDILNNDPQLQVVVSGRSKVKLSISDLLKLGVVEEVPGGSESNREFVLTGAYQYYLAFAKKLSAIMKPV